MGDEAEQAAEPAALTKVWAVLGILAGGIVVFMGIDLLLNSRRARPAADGTGPDDDCGCQ
jgi:hypothetical protein